MSGWDIVWIVYGVGFVIAFVIQLFDNGFQNCTEDHLPIPLHTGLVWPLYAVGLVCAFIAACCLPERDDWSDKL